VKQLPGILRRSHRSFDNHTAGPNDRAQNQNLVRFCKIDHKLLCLSAIKRIKQ
jgi:hypothetical protein